MQTIQRRQCCYSRVSDRDFHPLPPWSEVKGGTVCIFLSLLVVKPIPECVWDAVEIQADACAGCCKELSVVLCSGWPGLLSICPHSFLHHVSVAFPKSLALFLTCSYPWMPRRSLPFLLWFLPLFAVFLSLCFLAPPLDETEWCPAVLPFGSNGVVASLLPLFPSHCRNWAAGSSMPSFMA